jgi:hypothetical protein
MLRRSFIKAAVASVAASIVPLASWLPKRREPSAEDGFVGFVDEAGTVMNRGLVTCDAGDDIRQGQIVFLGADGRVYATPGSDRPLIGYASEPATHGRVAVAFGY